MSELPPTLNWIVDDMAALLNSAPMEDIQQYFFKRTGREDPMIDFYEPFLQAYDSALREVRGVYYTPEPVVGYIVRSLHHLIQHRLGRVDGLADKHTLILDPATGTGSFLFATIDEIHAHVIRQDGSAAWGSYVTKYLLGRLFGFELLMAPYAIAHLKLGLQLVGQGAQVTDGERFGVYLTNTLDDAIKKSDLLMGKFISDEANAAVKIKTSDPILVVLGNPPYERHSVNSTRKADGELTNIGRIIESYRLIDGSPIEERNTKALQNDYVKFLAFAQDRIQRTGEGLFGYICPHGLLSDTSLAGVRWSFLRTFNEIYVLDLHGNVLKGEKSQDGSIDQSVFQIKQGTQIIFGVKCNSDDTACVVHHAEVRGSRSAKYSYLQENDVSSVSWEIVHPQYPDYLFIPQNIDSLEEYKKGMKVSEIFLEHQSGLIAGRDSLSIGFSAEQLWDRVRHFASLPAESAREVYGLGSDARDWGVQRAQDDVNSSGLSKSNIRRILYRPFDVRSIYYTKKSRGFLRWPYPNFMQHMTAGENVALVTSRFTKGEKFAHVQVSRDMVEVICLSSKTSNNGFVFPLYLYPELDGQKSLETERRPNLSPDFLRELREKLDLPNVGDHGLPDGVKPEDIFYYIYAILHSPSYRTNYEEFLKSDFPRVPITSDNSLFFDLVAMGRRLVALHLLDEEGAPFLQHPGHQFEGVGNNAVEKAKVEWHRATGRVTINSTQGFEGVEEEVWQFLVGGYQVAEKWLKDRSGRILSFDDQIHYRQLLAASAATIQIMSDIDARIPGWPLV